MFFVAILVSVIAFSQKKELEYIDGIRVTYGEPGFVVGMDEQFNYVFLNTATSNRFVLVENINGMEDVVAEYEALTLKVQNGFFYASKFKYDPNNPMGDYDKTDDELASAAIVKYSINYLRQCTK